LAVLLVSSACQVVANSPAPGGAIPPPQPTVGYGSNGPCTVPSSPVSGAGAASGQSISIYYPGGTGATPVTGGTCNDNHRPVVAVVHGLGASSTLLYAGLIDHLVSTGNVVIFATYNTTDTTMTASFQDELAALQASVSDLTSGDLTRFGIIGHSEGGGASAYLAQRVEALGWGTTSFWVYALNPWYLDGVGTGPIPFPANTRLIVQNGDDDSFVDNRIGIDYFDSVPLPATQKVHVDLITQTVGNVTLDAQHTMPNSVISPDDAMKYYGMYRNADVLENCSLTNTACNWSQLTFMGTWSDGTPVTPAIVSQNPTDRGPIAIAECDNSSNSRAVDCGPSIVTTPDT
jgi:hypothetical protein